MPEKIAEPLQIIFNKSLRQDKYPSSWKIAHAIAILNRISHENQTPPARQENQRKYAQLPLVE
jgi:hypothetical protein